MNKELENNYELLQKILEKNKKLVKSVNEYKKTIIYAKHYIRDIKNGEEHNALVLKAIINALSLEILDIQNNILDMDRNNIEK